MYYFIYKIENSINGKMYIGQTIRPITQRFKEHQFKSSGCLKIKRAFAKYGASVFHIKLILITHSEPLADEWERYFIAKYNSVNCGYNIRDGGARGKLPLESRLKISEANKKQKNRYKWPKGKPCSPDIKAKISATMIGVKRPQSVIDKISKSKMGKKWTLVNGKRVYTPATTPKII
jgi:group I intron endonuclease